MTATITGRMKGAPRSVISSARPPKRRRASARATGTASTAETVADSAACQSVNQTARQSQGPSADSPPAWVATAASVPRISSTSSPAASPPGEGLSWRRR